MKIIEKYLIYEWLKWFGLCFLVLYSLLFLQLLADQEEFLELDSFGTFLVLFTRFALSYLSWLFPVGCFVATLFTFSFLAKNRELLVLDTSGCSPFFIARPIIGLAIIISFLSWYSQDTEKLEQWFKTSIGGEELPKNILVPSFKMILPSVHRTWYFQSFDLLNGTAKQIHLYCYDKNGSELYRIRSESARLSTEGWHFNDGNFLGFSSSKGIPVVKNNRIYWDPFVKSFDEISSVRTSSPRYNKRFTELYLPEIFDDPTPFAYLKTKPQDLSFEKLSELIDNFPDQNSSKLNPYRLRRTQLLWNVPGCFLAVMCALALSLRNEQRSVGFITGLSLLYILVFYIIRSLCDALGEKGILSDWVATGIPFALVFVVSVRMICKNR
ncbi:MAG: LptF/LptG family permease [Opitutales bacterium]|nr:LptF/LptG family permease [Opitutales bacterium]